MTGLAADTAQDVLNGLVDPMRRRILDALAIAGSATATTLAAQLPVSRQAVVKHLAVLDRAGLVTGARAGREMRYQLRPEQLTATADWLATLAAEWDRRLHTIKRLAESLEAAAQPAPAEPAEVRATPAEVRTTPAVPAAQAEVGATPAEQVEVRAAPAAQAEGRAGPTASPRHPEE